MLKILLSSLKARVVATFVLLILLAQGITSIVIVQQAKSDATEKLGVFLSGECRFLIESLDKSMWTWANQIEVLSKTLALTGHTSNTASAVINALQEIVPEFSWVGLTDMSGVVVAATDDVLLGKSIAQRPVFREGIKGNFVGDVHDAVLLANLLPNPTGEAMKFVDVSFPVHSPTGEISGVLAAHLSWAWAQDVEKNMLQTSATEKGIELFVIASDGAVILGKSSFLGKPLDIPLVHKNADSADSWGVQAWPDGRLYLTAVAHGSGYGEYSGLGWTAVARQPLDLAYEPIASLMKRMLLTSLVLALFFVAAGWYIANKIISPLKELTGAAKALERGIPVEFPRKHPIREIEVLSNALANLFESLTHSNRDRDRIRHAAAKDPLTGLLNRMGLAAYIDSVEPKAMAEGLSIDVFYMDLDGFKPINDNLGHPVGDLVLIEVAKRLTACLRENDVLVRLGGDEFLALIEISPNSPQVAGRIGTCLIESVGHPMQIEGHHISVGISIGHATWQGNDPKLKAAIEHADDALYEAKKAGKNRMVSS